MAPIRVWSRTSSSRRCSTSPQDIGVQGGRTCVSREEWGQLAQKLGVKVIHIAERDTQISKQPEAARRVRQYLVGRWVRERGLAACRARLGHRTSATFPRDGARHDFGCQAAIYLNAAGRRHPRAHLDAESGAFPRLPDHARRVDLDRRLFHRARRHERRVSADRALRLSPVRQRGAVGARVRGPQLAPAGSQTHHDGGHHAGHR